MSCQRLCSLAYTPTHTKVVLFSRNHKHNTKYYYSVGSSRGAVRSECPSGRLALAVFSTAWRLMGQTSVCASVGSESWHVVQSVREEGDRLEWQLLSSHTSFQLRHWPGISHFFGLNSMIGKHFLLLWVYLVSTLARLHSLRCLTLASWLFLQTITAPMEWTSVTLDFWMFSLCGFFHDLSQ